MHNNLGPFHPLSYPPKQVKREVVENAREVVVRTTVTIETRTPTTIFYYKGKTDKEILEYEGTQETEDVLEEFARDLTGTPTDKVTLVRTVEIVDKQ